MSVAGADTEALGTGIGVELDIGVFRKGIGTELGIGVVGNAARCCGTRDSAGIYNIAYITLTTIIHRSVIQSRTFLEYLKYKKKSNKV